MSPVSWYDKKIGHDHSLTVFFFDLRSSPGTRDSYKRVRSIKTKNLVGITIYYDIDKKLSISSLALNNHQ